MNARRTTEAVTTFAETQWVLLSAAARKAINFSQMSVHVKVSDWHLSSAEKVTKRSLFRFF